MAQRGIISPRRQGVGITSRLATIDASPPSTPPDVQRAVAPHRNRPRNACSYFVAVLEGVVSGVAFYSVWAAAMPIISSDERDFPAQKAMRSGACLALGAPFFVLAARCAIQAAGLRFPTVQQPSLGFSVPVGFDEHAVLDLYVIGLAAAALGMLVPGLELTGNFLGTLLASLSLVWICVATALAMLGVYFGVTVFLSSSAPVDGFAVHTRPKKGTWAACAAGHALLLSSCFYSPDVERALGFMLGLVHIMRLLQQALSYPGTGTREEGPVGVAEP